MQKYFLEIIVFLCGTVVMILELVGSRLLAPFLGNSLFVWTSLIGVILGSLSLGYWWGGRLADQNPTYKIFSMIIFVAALFIGMIDLIKYPILNIIYDNFDLRLGSIVSSIILFTPASVLLGMVSPYAVKLRMKNLEASGRTVGNLYAVSTVGSIFGTFLAGFFLISFFGDTKIIVILTVSLLATSLLAWSGGLKKIRWSLILILAIYFIGLYVQTNSLAKQNKIELDTQYNHVIIYDGIENITNRPTRYLITGPYILQSAMFLDKDDDLVFDYSKYYRLAEHFDPGFKNALLIGGGAYSFPKDYLKRYQDATLDVVEIDPMLTEIARQYFNLRPNPRLKIYHQDGRIFLNRTENKYDVIYLDAFKSYEIPFHLTTQETVEKIYQALNNNGVVLSNLISAIEGDKGKFLRAEYATYKSVFPQVYLLPVQNKDQATTSQNIILLALKSTATPTWTSANSDFNEYLSHLWRQPILHDVPVLNDDFSPVEQYMAELLM